MEDSELVISKLEIASALEKINNSLNYRFEKDASLFISNQQGAEIKELIKNNIWQSIYGIFQTNKLSSEILTISIINNCWLASNKLSQNDVKNYIEPIFESCNKYIFLNEVKRVIENKVSVNEKIKRVLDILYYKYIDLAVCKRIIDTNDIRTYNRNILNICLERVLETCNTPTDLYFTIEKYLEKYECLAREGIIFRYATTLLKSRDTEWNREFAEYVFNEEINLENPELIEDVWMNLFKNFEYIAIDISYKNIKTLEDDEIDKRTVRRLIRECIIFNINRDDDKYDENCEMWLSNFNSSIYPIKKEFVYSVNKLKCNELIIDKMLECHMPEHLIKSLQETRDGEKDDECISDIDTLKDKLIINPNRNNKKNYFRYVYNIMDSDLKMMLFWGLKPFVNDENVVEFLIQLIEEKREEAQDICEIIISGIEESNKCDDLYVAFINLIKVKRFEYENVVNFIQKRDFELYKKLYNKRN